MKRWVIPALLALLLVALSTGCGSQGADAARPISGTSGKGGHGGTSVREAAAPGIATSRAAGRKIASTRPARAATTGPDGRPGDTRAGTTAQAPPATTTARTATTGASLPAPVVKVERLQDPFVDDPQARGGSGYEADSILGVRHGEHADYERVVVDLGVGKMPAEKVPEWTLSSPTGDGLLRVTLPSVSATKVPDGDFGDSLVRSFYVVRAPEGGMFVDVFVRRAFTYRVLELSDPARLVVDFKPSDAKLTLPLPATGGNTVLTEPRAGAQVSGPLIVSGYSRNPEAMNTIILKGPNGKVLLRRSVQSNDWSATWGYFETTLDPPPFTGEATLQVGTFSARDGSFVGVKVPVRGG